MAQNLFLEIPLVYPLEHEKYKLTGGFNVYEDLTVTDKDRFQYILPYYNFTKNINPLSIGTLNFSSKGDNILDNTNNMKSKVINDLSFKTNNLIFDELGIKNNFNVYHDFLSLSLSLHICIYITT